MFIELRTASQRERPMPPRNAFFAIVSPGPEWPAIRAHRSNRPFGRVPCKKLLIDWPSRSSGEGEKSLRHRLRDFPELSLRNPPDSIERRRVDDCGGES